MEGNSITIIVVYSGCSNYRPTKITSNVFDDCFGIRKIRFGIDIEALLMVVVTFGLEDVYKRQRITCTTYCGSKIQRQCNGCNGSSRSGGTKSQ